MRQKVMNPSRALYDQLVSEYPKSRFPNVIVTDSYLLLMKSLQGGALNNVQFDILTNASTGTPPTCIERRLNLSDKFTVRDMAVCLMKTAAATTANVSTQAEINIGIPRTYPNASVFAAAGEAANLEALYNGFVTIIINSTVYYQSLDMRRFYRVPTSQKGVAVSTVATTGVVGDDGWDILNYSFSPVQPQFTFSGDGNNQAGITIGNSVSMAGATTSQNWVVAIFRGFLIQNVNNK